MGLKHVYTDLDRDGRPDDAVMQHPNDPNHIYVDKDGDGFYDDRIPVTGTSNGYMTTDADGDGVFDDVIFTEPSHSSHTHSSPSGTKKSSSSGSLLPKLSLKTWLIIFVVLFCTAIPAYLISFIIAIVELFTR